MALWSPSVGTIIRTPFGVGMIAVIDHPADQYVVQFNNHSAQYDIRIDIRTVLPEEYLGHISEPEFAEKFMAGELSTEDPMAAIDLPCKQHVSDCHCTWCYKISSNGFHFSNQGQCHCSRDNCPCVPFGMT